MIKTGNTTTIDRRFNVAPMIDLTDRHCRYFFRLMSLRTRLYTEMITCPAIIHGDQEHLLGFNAQEQPLAVQLGGSKPDEFAYCAKVIESRNYNEININVGCPSDRVQSGKFGACLMKEPELLAECFLALKENCSLPVTIKCRLGVDEYDNDEFFLEFIDTLTKAGCDTFIVHARIALLKGLSPKENRTVPPLNYARVHKLKTQKPELDIIVNGGIQSLTEAKKHLQDFDGVMLGREVYKDPFLLSLVDQEIYSESTIDSKACLATNIQRADVVENYITYMHQEMEKGVRAHSMARHLVGLYHKQALGRYWRQFISSNPIKNTDDLKQLVSLARHIDEKNSITREQEQLSHA